MSRWRSTSGLTGVTVEQVSWETRFESSTHFWNLVLSSNPIAVGMTSGLTAEQTADVRQVLDGMLRERSGGTPGAVLHAEVNIGTGRK